MKKIISVISTGLSLTLPAIASAQLLTDATNLAATTEAMTQRSTLGNMPLGTVIAFVIQGALALLSIVFIILMIIAGFRWMTAGGNEEDIKKASGTIRHALIGLIFILAAYAITYFVFKYLPFGVGGSTGGAV